MPDLFTRKTRPKDVKEWLSQLPSETGEDYARRYALGSDLKNRQTPSGNPDTSLNGSVIAKKQRVNFLQRFSIWLRTSTIFSPREKADENIIPVMEDDQVLKRLDGESLPDIIVPDSSLQLHKTEQPSLQAMPQPEPERQGDNNLAIARYPQQDKEEPDFDNLRKNAIEGYEAPVPINEPSYRMFFSNFKKWFDQLSILQKSLIILGPLFSLGLIIFLIIQFGLQPSNSPVSTPDNYLVSSVPVPDSIILPDGQAFKLGVGYIQDGLWIPQGAEWLAGTEVPRWLALPWDKQLESTVLAYQGNEPIELQMNNKDIITYRFQSIQEISAEEMGTFHKNTADLLILISKKGTATLMVIVAVP
jgi:hypothetical protein